VGFVSHDEGRGATEVTGGPLHTFLSRELGISPPPTGKSLFPPAPVDNIM
jgi:hypothetical protein